MMFYAFLSARSGRNNATAPIIPFEIAYSAVANAAGLKIRDRPVFAKLPHGFTVCGVNGPDSETDMPECDWYKAHCTVKGERGYYPEVRDVWTTKHRFHIAEETVDRFCAANGLSIVNSQDGCELIKYDTGCFAARHDDRLGDVTVLFFRKNQQCTGGELVLYDWFAPGGRVVFDPANLAEDVMVAFPTWMTHEVKPVTSGTRFVYKMGLMHDAAVAAVASVKSPAVKSSFPPSISAKPIVARTRSRNNCNLD